MPSLSNFCILLVEDEYLIAMHLQELLESAGAEILGPVATIDAALELIEEHAARLSAAILDVNLGGGSNSYPIADRLKEISVPFAFATGEIRLRQDQAYPNIPFLQKPVLEGELMGVMGELVARAR